MHSAASAGHPGPSDTEIAALARRLDRPVVLVGLMGVGKSTVGKKLAALLKSDFVDADAEIEQAAAMSIGEIFERFGEAYFRDGERRVIARLMEERRGVIATGGGAFVDPETRALILEQGVAVWLDAHLDTLVARTSRKSHRPLLNTGHPAEILGRLKTEREPLYAEAPIRVTSDEGPHLDTALRIVEAIDRWL
ncbi:shikimate kinase [Tsuneonella amylolytica]|uniref:shikimate kinase n=1 Tax=Tsuneonella amylolytica TaxID=2338327 RepID=UPI000EAAB311|nr:shikimate kinase [Tsuneonella amylolytica]